MHTEKKYGKPSLRRVSQTPVTGEVLQFLNAKGYRVESDDN